MAQALALSVPSKIAADKLAEWLSRMVHNVRVSACNGSWCIYVPQAALSRARRALREVVVAANPRRGARVVARKVKPLPRARLNSGPTIPKGQIEWLVDRLHVGTSDEDVEKEIRKRATGGAWTPAKVRQAVAHAVAHHRRNRGIFTKVVVRGIPNPAAAGDWTVRELGFDGKTGKMVQFFLKGPFRTQAEATKWGRENTKVPFTVARGRKGVLGANKNSAHAGTKRYNVWAYNRATGGSFELERNVTAKAAVRAYRAAVKQGLRPWCIDLSTRNEVHPTRSGNLPNPVNKRARREARRAEIRLKESLGQRGRPLAQRGPWTGGKDAYNEGRRAGSGYARFWLWNDREWKLNMRNAYDGVESLREASLYFAREEADKKGIATRFPGKAGMWKAGFVLGFEDYLAKTFGPKRDFNDFGESREMDQSKRLARRRREHWKKLHGKNPSSMRPCCRKLGHGGSCAKCGKHAHFTVDWIIPSRVPDTRTACSSACAVALKKGGAASNPSIDRAWDKMTSRQRLAALQVVGLDRDAADTLSERRWGLIAPFIQRLLRERWAVGTEIRRRETVGANRRGR